MRTRFRSSPARLRACSVRASRALPIEPDEPGELMSRPSEPAPVADRRRTVRDVLFLMAKQLAAAHTTTAIGIAWSPHREHVTLCVKNLGRPIRAQLRLELRRTPGSPAGLNPHGPP